MEIKWLGHACFSLWTGRNTIVFDPYAPMGAYGELKVEANKVLVSHGHFDHNYVSGVSLSDWIEDENCLFDTVASYHDDQLGALRGDNLIHIVTVDGFKVVHLGDLGHVLQKDALDFIRGCDMLLIPVGGFFTIDAATALTIIKDVMPKAIIPMHYRFGEYGPEPISGVDPFLDAVKDMYSVIHCDTNCIENLRNLQKGVYVLKFCE